MKRNQIIILTLFFVISAVIYFILRKNKSDDKPANAKQNTELFVPIRKVKNEIHPMEINAYGQVSPTVELDVAFEVQGRLQKGSMTLKPGVRFSQGQTLYSVDGSEARQTLSARRTQFAQLIIAVLADLEMDYPQAHGKWVAFLNSIQPSSMLPELPAIQSGKERMFVTSKNIVAEYYNIKSLEERYKKYVYNAPWSGSVVDIVAEPGSIINPGVKIARIAKTGDFEVKVPISLSQIEIFKQKGVAKFTNSKSELVGTGKIIRISDVINQKTQSVDVYYSISVIGNAKIYNGMFLNASINQTSDEKSMGIPRMAVKDGLVMVLVKDKLLPRNVEIVNNKPDTVFVTGLKNGEQVVLEQIQSLEKITKFKGITR